jgi:hypothetical protein
MYLWTKMCSADIQPDSRGVLSLMRLRGRNGKDILLRPAPVLAIDGAPVRVDECEGTRFSVVAGPVTGTLNAAADDTHPNGCLRLSISLRAEQTRIVRVDVGWIRTARDDGTVWFNPRAGGGLVRRTASFEAVYPGGASACAVFCLGTKASGGAGPVLGFFNEEQRRICLRADIAPVETTLTASFEQLELPAGVSVDLPEAYLTVSDNWEDALAPYTRWVREHRPPRTETPGWVESRAWHFFTARISSFPDDQPAKLHAELDRGIRLCERVGAVPLIWLGHWWSGCCRTGGRWYFDHFQGDFLEVPSATREAVRYSHSRGAQVLVYLNITSIGELSSSYHATDGKLLIGAKGQTVRNAEYPMMMLCPAAQGTREYWFEVVDFLFGDLEVDGVFLDQAGGGHRAPYCYATDHGHDEIDVYGSGMIELLAALRERIHRHDPEAIIVGELAHDFRSSYIDLWIWHWNWSRLENRGGYGETLIWMRKLCPDALFVEQEAFRASPTERALELAGRGVWVNGTYSAGAAVVDRHPEQLPDQPDYHELLWEAQRSEPAALWGEPEFVHASEYCSAVLFRAPQLLNRALLSLMHPQRGTHTSRLHLPAPFGPWCSITPWPHGMATGSVSWFDGVAHATFEGRATMFILDSGEDSHRLNGSEI